MSLALAAARADAPTSFEFPRREPSTSFGATKPVESEVRESASKTDHMIRQIEQAAAKVSETLNRLKRQDEIVAGLHARIAELEDSNMKAEEAAGLHAARAESAERDLARLDGEHAIQSRDLQRLKTNIDRLMAIFAAQPVVEPN